MKRRNLLLGGISAAAVAVVGKNVAKVEPEKVTITLKNGSRLMGDADGVSTSGYQVQQTIADALRIQDETIIEHFKKQDWYQTALRERVMREMYPPAELHRPDGTVEYIPMPIMGYRNLETVAYGYIDAPYQAKRKAAMDAKFALDTEAADT